MKKLIKIGSQFSGVGAFEQSLISLGIDFENVYAAEWDKYARQTYLLNFQEPEYYVQDVKDTPIEEITKKHGSLDIAMFSPPCQAFSLAGKRLGKEDERGILFFNSLEFIEKNKPRFFIFENVKGLLSHEKPTPKHTYGSTFQEWINCLGGKSVNGVHTFFPHENSVPYHIYFDVLNAKDYGVPQNRERVFIIGIRDDEDNNFQFPKPFPLTKRLKDILETNVDEKYFLSDKMIKVLTHHQNKIIENDNPEESCTIHAGYFKMGGRDQQYVKDANFSSELNQVGSLYENNSDAGRIHDTNSVSCTLKSEGGGGGAKTGLYLVENEVKGVAQTLDTACNQGVMVGISVLPNSKKLEYNGIDENICPSLLATDYKAPKTWHFSDFRIRKLTPRECFRLMGFDDSFKYNVSDSQAYKQAGNSIVKDVLMLIIKNLKIS